MTKETMIWQSCSMVIAGMVRRNEIPDTVESFENKVVKTVGSFVGYSDKDIREVLQNNDCTEFADVLSKLYST